MANAEQVKALIRSHADGDDSRFYAIAMQVAAQAARHGHSRFAQELKGLIDEAKERAHALAPTDTSRPIPLAKPRGELSGLLSFSYPKSRLSDMSLDSELRGRLERTLLEQRERQRILEHGLTPMRKLLLVGPPGTGKTMTASVLAGELSLPLFAIQLHGLITKYLGETAAKLRLIFDAIDQTRGVYFFDEFDAVGGERAGRNDVGEIRRVLNSFLQFLEQDASDSLVIAATNHVELLDPALFRRFDLVLRYPLPDPEIAEKIMRGRLAMLDTSKVRWAELRDAAEGLSHADIAQSCDQAAKNAVLDRRKAISTIELALALAERKLGKR